MGRNDEIIRLLQYLQNQGILATNDFADDLKRLIKTNYKTFAKELYKDFTRKDFENYNRFKKLRLTSKQKEKIGGITLWRYEYRKTSNLRCIFIVQEEYNNINPVLICAFNEDGSKNKGVNSYKDNIERSINIIKENWRE